MWIYNSVRYRQVHEMQFIEHADFSMQNCQKCILVDCRVMAPEEEPLREECNRGNNGYFVEKDWKKKQEGGGHYKKYAIQPAEYCQKNRLNHCESAIVKYATRHQDKNGREDILKIIHYAEMILAMEYNEDTEVRKD